MGKLWSEIEVEIIAEMRNRAWRLRLQADELEKKADEREKEKKLKEMSEKK